MFQPSSHSLDYGAAEAKGGDPLKIHGISRLDEGKLREAAKKAEKAMWKAKLLSKERVALEKKANELKKAADQARTVKSTKLLDAKPDVLWSTPINKRLVNFAGLLGSALAGGMSGDQIVAIAGGAQVGAPFTDGEMRKSILGALLALNATGATSVVDIKQVKAPIIGNEQVNTALAKASGMPGKDLKSVYAATIKRVSGYGPSMKALAWSLRGQLWLADVAGIEAVHATGGAVVALIPGVGTAIGAAIGAHSAITMALAQALGLKLDAEIKKALPKAKAEAEAVAKSGGVKAQPGQDGMYRARDGSGPLAALTSLPLPMKLVLGAVGLGAAALVVRRIAS